MHPLREGFAQAARRLAKLDETLTGRLAPPAAAGAASGPLGQGDVTPLIEELRRVREAVESLPAALPPPGAPTRSAAASWRGRCPPSSSCSTPRPRASRPSIPGSSSRWRRSDRRSTWSRRGSIAPAARPRRGQLEASLGGLADTRRELDELGRAFREVAGNSRVLLDAHHGGGEERDPELVAALDQLSRTVERFNQRVRAFVRRADEELARSSRLLTSVVGTRGQEPH